MFLSLRMGLDHMMTQFHQMYISFQILISIYMSHLKCVWSANSYPRLVLLSLFLPLFQFERGWKWGPENLTSLHQIILLNKKIYKKKSQLCIFLSTTFVEPMALTLKEKKNVHQILNLGLRFQIIIMSIYIFTHIFKKLYKKNITRTYSGQRMSFSTLPRL